MKIFDLVKVTKERNYYKLQYEILKEEISSDVFKKMLKKLNESEKIKKLQDDNKNLRKQNNKLKERLRENGASKKGRKKL